MKTTRFILGFSVALLAAACSSTTKDSSAPAGTPPDGGSSGSSGGDGGSSGGEGGSSSGGNATSCSTGSLFAGNPVYSGMASDRPASGTGVLADPPLQWSSLTFVGNTLYTRDTGEIWAVDTTAASPVETRIAGLNPATDFDFTDGPCATARLTAVQGIVGLPDGSLAATDAFANAVVHIKNPSNAATCAVEYWAGTHTPQTGIDPTIGTPNGGDVDGALGTSKLDYPTAITADDAGVVYFFDENSRKFKAIANDAAHTVSTIAPSPDGLDKVWNMTHIGSSLYAIATDSAKTAVLKIDPATRMITTVVSGGADGTYDPIPSSAYPLLGGITTDGTNLLVSGKGYVWSLTTSGKLTVVAGSGENIDWPTPDAKKTAPAMALQLVSAKSASEASVGSPDYIAYHAGSVYVRSRGASTSAYVTKISCP